MSKDTINKIKKKIKPILKENKVKKAGIFGSYARGEESENSDIDILIDLDKNLSLLKLIELKIKLEKILKKKVDLIEYDLIHPLIKKDAFKEEVKIL